jgi:thiol:disulfide interchange protein DsbD
MENNWHIYWLNPGDSGEPPSVRWRLPQGITASALLWPTPTRLTTTAGTDYGYRGSAVLLSTLTIPATVQPGSAPPIVADVRWLVCHDICVPQQAQVSATLPIAAAKDGSAVDATVQPLFAAATQQLPKPIPAAFQLFASSASSTAFRLSFIAPYQLASAIFFPANSEQIDNSAPQQLVQDRNTTHLDLKKSDYLQRDPERLQGVLVLNQISYAIDVPVHKSAPRSPALSKEGQP